MFCGSQFQSKSRDISLLSQILPKMILMLLFHRNFTGYIDLIMCVLCFLGVGFVNTPGLD